MSASSAPVPATAPVDRPVPRRRGFAARTWGIAWRAGAALLFVVALLAVWLLFFFPDRLAVRVAASEAKKFGVVLSIGRLDLKPLSGVTLEKLAVDVPANAGMQAP